LLRDSEQVEACTLKHCFFVLISIVKEEGSQRNFWLGVNRRKRVNQTLSEHVGSALIDEEVLVGIAVRLRLVNLHLIVALTL